jgi:hypothetical protein
MHHKEPKVCPTCKTGDGLHDIDDRYDLETQIDKVVGCHNCGTQWIVHYEFVSWEIVHHGEPQSQS